MIKTKYDGLILELEAQGDQEAAEAIRELVGELVNARATFNTMTIDADDMNRIGAGVSRARIDRFLELETD